jgi:hypothetical protein
LEDTLTTEKLRDYGERAREVVERSQKRLEAAIEILAEVQKEQARTIVSPSATHDSLLGRLVETYRASRTEKLEAQLDMAREALGNSDEDDQRARYRYSTGSKPSE